MTRQVRFASCLWLALSMGCQDDGGLLVPNRGVIPRADACVAEHDGKLVMVPFTGSAVSLTLDASHSLDPDGRIATYRWLSGTRVEPVAGSGAAGAAGSGAAPVLGRVLPANAALDWPDDIEKPNVELGEGSYAFTLWVIDDRGLVSAPDVVSIVVER